MSKRCWPWSHQWTKWENREEAAPLMERGTTFRIGTLIVQLRTCENCGKLQLRTAKTRIA